MFPESLDRAPRFTVSLHDHPFEHLDMFLEDPPSGAVPTTLQTWHVPGSGLDTLRWPGVTRRQADHRWDYLDYEGAVEPDRGTIRRLDTGSYDRVDCSSAIVVDLRGRHLRGRLSLWEDGASGWRSSWREGNGLFVAVEGIDGSGKSSAARAVAERLEAEGYTVWLTREPTDEGFGAALRERLVAADHRVPLAMALGFAADRAEHVFGAQGVLARRARGEIVICDRYKLSSLAYQSQAGVDPAIVDSLNQTFPDPDLTVLIDVPPTVALERLTRSEGRGTDLYERSSFLEGVAGRYEGCLGSLGASGGAAVQTAIVDGTEAPARVGDRLHALVSDLVRGVAWNGSGDPE